MKTTREATASRLLDAALEIIGEAGWEGATTRAIADGASVNEVTLFRHFGTKQGVMVAAVARAMKTFGRAVDQPTADLQSQLVALATRYVAFVDAYPGLVVRVLPAMGHDPEAARALGPFVEALRDRLSRLLEEQQRAGTLSPEPIADAVRAFIGPLLARPLLAHSLPAEAFDPDAYVRLFLAGRSIAPTGATKRD